MFWFGDLNFRIESLDICFVKYAIDSNVLSQLWEKDQVRDGCAAYTGTLAVIDSPQNCPRGCWSGHVLLQLQDTEGPGSPVSGGGIIPGQSGWSWAHFPHECVKES